LLDGFVSQMLPYNQKHISPEPQGIDFYDVFGRHMGKMLYMEFMPLYGADFSTNQSIFGSAPDVEYPVLMENNGARHVLYHSRVKHELLLGEGFDASQVFVRNLSNQNNFVSKQQATQNDGVVFLTAIRANETSDILVTTTAPGTIYAWIDYNKDGIWTVDEKIISGVSVDAGDTVLPFTVPLGVAGGESYARFRLCDCPDDMDPVGVLSGGEVEDYLVQITSAGSTVQGTVWLDANSNGSRDEQENGLAGIKVYADLNSNGVHDTNEPVATTNATGEYSLGGLPNGSVQIQPVYGSSWSVTNISGPKYMTVELIDGLVVKGLNFGLFGSMATNLDDEMGLPVEFSLDQNYPNPFNPTTSIRYELAESIQVTLTVYDMNGRVVATLVDKQQNAGAYTVVFDATKLASGVYVYRLQAGSHVFTQKLTLIK
jgi:hypothetical protein